MNCRGNQAKNAALLKNVAPILTMISFRMQKKWILAAGRYKTWTGPQCRARGAGWSMCML